MRGRLAILLLALYTCSIIHLDELLKLPKLLAHFQTHHCTDPSMSFTDFLGLHYTMDQFQQNDYEEDMKLPFKVPQNCMNNFSFFVQNVKRVFTNGPVPTEYLTSIHMDNFNTGSAVFSNAVWHPPKG